MALEFDIDSTTESRTRQIIEDDLDVTGGAG
jgi:hypothetical protein